MSLQDRINAGQALLALTRDLTPDEQETVKIGAASASAQASILNFEWLLQTYPDVAADVVADFQQDPSYQVLMKILGGSSQ
jgi:hypothetical protein